MINRKRNSRGVTLVALIITVIVMLLLVGVTINVALNGGLFSTTKKAKEETEMAVYREKIDSLRPILVVEEMSDGLTSKEFIDRYEEELKKDINFKESTITRKDEETIILMTKEKYVFEITEQETNHK